MVSTPANEPTLTLTPEQFQRLTIHAVHRHLPLSRHADRATCRATAR